MTVSHIVPPINQYSGDGATKTFTFTYQVMVPSTDLLIYFIVGGTPTLQTTGYTVALLTPKALPSTGTVTFATAPPVGTTVSIVRQTYEARTTNYVTGPIQPATLNMDIDNTVLMIQDISYNTPIRDGAGNYNFGSYRITGVANPLNTGDAVNYGILSSLVASIVSSAGIQSFRRTTSTSYTVVSTDTNIAFTGAGNTTIILPSAGVSLGRSLTVKMEVAHTLVSSSSNVIPLIGGSAGTSILSATAGKFAKIVSDGTAWTIMEAN